MTAALPETGIGDRSAVCIAVLLSSACMGDRKAGRLVIAEEEAAASCSVDPCVPLLSCFLSMFEADVAAGPINVLEAVDEETVVDSEKTVLEEEVSFLAGS